MNEENQNQKSLFLIVMGLSAIAGYLLASSILDRRRLDVHKQQLRTLHTLREMDSQISIHAHKRLNALEADLYGDGSKQNDSNAAPMDKPSDLVSTGHVNEESSCDVSAGIEEKSGGPISDND